MTVDDAENESPTVEPRPMAIRVLAALAIVAILVLSMWAVIHAATNIKKTVHNDLTIHLIPAERLSPPEQLRADAAVLQRRARALGYGATAAVGDGTIDLATTKKVAGADLKTLLEQG